MKPLTAHQFVDVAQVRRFLLGGNARFTLVSAKTGVRFTFRVAVCEDNAALWFVSVLTGADNESSFTYLGTLRDSTPGPRFAHGRKSRIAESAPSAKAIDWFLRAVFAAEPRLPDAVQFWHEGRCCRCGRALTVPSSIEAGIGPECAEKDGLFLAA